MIKVNRITITDIEKLITSRQNEGVHISALRRTLITLGQIMAYAVRHKYISYNPVRDIERPITQGKERKSTIKVLSPEEIKVVV